MKLATIRTGYGTTVARVDGDTLVAVHGYPSLDRLLAESSWAAIAGAADGEVTPLAEADYAPVTTPSKTFCVGLNYRTHIAEMGRPTPRYPTLFAKFANALIGARDPLTVPSVTDRFDWEGELGVVVGQPIYRSTPAEAVEAIAGYTVLNDVTARDWQRRTNEWLAGKTFQASTPVGPWLVTPDDVDHARDLRLRTEVDGVVMQDSTTADLLFPPAEILSYISQFTTLLPGDLVATGTPGGVGDGRDPQAYLHPGAVLRTLIDGLGECLNHCVPDRS